MLGPIHFDDSSHTYRNIWGDVYTSSTQLVSKFKQPFDGPKIAAAYAKKNGGTPEYWLAEWDRIRDTACDRGTEFHKQKEERILAMQRMAMYGRLYEVWESRKGEAAVDELRNLPDGLHVELLLWDHDAKIAGQADIVAIETDPATGKRFVDIDDHKTNKKIDRESYCHWRDGHRMMLPPVAHLMDCNFQHYELQLSVYAWILERAGFVPRRVQFTHYGPAGADGIVPSPQAYPVEYRRSEVGEMVGALIWA
jgi:hypothetical protein